MPKIYFFQLPKVNKYCLGVELDPAHLEVIKKTQNGSFVGLLTVSHFMPQRLQNMIKKKTKQNKKGMPVTAILITCT